MENTSPSLCCRGKQRVTVQAGQHAWLLPRREESIWWYLVWYGRETTALTTARDVGVFAGSSVVHSLADHHKPRTIAYLTSRWATVMARTPSLPPPFPTYLLTSLPPARTTCPTARNANTARQR